MSKALLLEALLLARENDPEGAMSVCERGLEAAQGYGQRFEASLLARLFLTVNERTEMASGDIEKIVEAAALVDALGVVTTPRAYSLPTGSC